MISCAICALLFYYSTTCLTATWGGGGRGVAPVASAALLATVLLLLLILRVPRYGAKPAESNRAGERLVHIYVVASAPPTV